MFLYTIYHMPYTLEIYTVYHIRLPMFMWELLLGSEAFGNRPFSFKQVAKDMGVSKNQGPQYGPQIVGILFQTHAQKGPPIYRNSHIAAENSTPTNPQSHCSR